MEVLAVVWAPVRVLRDAAVHKRLLAAFVVTALYAALGLAGSVVAVLGGVTQVDGQPPGLPPGTAENIREAIEVSLVVSSVLTPFVLWIAVSLFMHFVTSFFGGGARVVIGTSGTDAVSASDGSLAATLAAVGISGMPLVISSAIGLVLSVLRVTIGAQSTTGIVLGYVAGLLGLAAFVWYVVLVVIGAAQARNLGYAESAGSCAVSCVGCAGLIILVLIVVGLGAALLIGPAISSSG
ncbi:MAG TPA: YIP1 family protein [Rubrobacter sp.]